MITFLKILEIYGINPTNIKLVRHGNKEIPIRDTFRHDLPRFEAYQSYQAPGKFGAASSIAVFAPYHGTTALFLGLWDVKGHIQNSELSEDNTDELEKLSLPKAWLEDHVKYHLVRNTALDELCERLVIEWGSATVAWVQSKDKKVVELKPESSIGGFRSFDRVELAFQDLKTIATSPDSNRIWITALSSVNGVYLIRHNGSGKLYVGSAYGEQGIWGRWKNYAINGHGGNIELTDLDPTDFQFSILEVVSATTTPDGVIECENRWKNKLGTRRFGLNSN